MEEDAQIKKAKEKQHAAKAYERMGIRDVMSLRTGRHFVWCLLNEFETPGFDPDPYINAFNSGMNMAAKFIKKDLIGVEVYDLYLKMISEHQGKVK